MSYVGVRWLYDIPDLENFLNSAVVLSPALPWRTSHFPECLLPIFHL